MNKDAVSKQLPLCRA